VSCLLARPAGGRSLTGQRRKGRSSITDQQRFVTGGVDTHNAIHVAAVVDEVGRILGPSRSPPSSSATRRLVRWMSGFVALARIGMDGTGSYGAGFARHLVSAGVELIQVNQPNRELRRHDVDSI
jgi:transposase